MSRRANKQTGLAAQLPLAMRTGKYLVGYKKVLNSVVKNAAKCIVVASNLPKMMRMRLEYYCVLANHTPIKFYEGNNNELSALCGLNHRASVISVLDQGEAELLGGN